MVCLVCAYLNCRGGKRGSPEMKHHTTSRVPINSYALLLVGVSKTHPNIGPVNDNHARHLKSSKAVNYQLVG